MVTAPQRSAREAGLRYVSDDQPGIRRKPWGRGFTYLDADGEHVKDPEVRERIESLAIPPAYTDVWICPDPRGHLQATGRDEKGRKQYIYHPRWQEVRERHKFEHMLDFAQALPAIRRRVREDLRKDGLQRDKVLAAVVRLLETTLIRVGNDSYARENESYGLTTIRKKHVDLGEDAVVFEFEGKGGQEWHVELEDQEIAEVVRRCVEIPGYELFKYFDEDGVKRDVESGDVNSYLKETTGDDITAKDFRTWAGTLLCALSLRDEMHESESEGKKKVVAAVKRVAEKLGNTPAVCRQSYIHPVVIDSYLRGRLAAAMERGAAAEGAPEGLAPEEAAVWALLKEATGS